MKRRLLFACLIGIAFTSTILMADLSSGLVVYWALDGDTTDSSGNGHDGTLVKNPEWVDAHFGEGLSLDGVDDGMNCEDDPALDITDSITVAAWLYTNSYSSWCSILLKSSNPLWTDGYGLSHFNGADGLHFWVTLWAPDAATNVPVEEWHHIAGTYDGSTLKIYVDGQEAGSQARAVTILTNNAPLEVGCGNGQYFWDGIIDEVALYNRALAPDEIQTLMDSPLGDKAVEPAGKLTTTWAAVKQ